MAVKCGEWPSVISADAACGQRALSCPAAVGGDVLWQEGRPAEGGRVTVVARSGSCGTLTDLLRAPWNARTRVHEDGGLSYLPVPRPRSWPAAAAGQPGLPPAIVFANFGDQRLYLADGAGQPRPLTPDPAAADGAPPAGGGADGTEPGGLRYADFALSPDRSEIWCVRERHAGGTVTRAIVAVPLDGSAAGDPAAVRELVTGWDFFAGVTPSPDGRHLAWICWNRPRMPWDGTQLRVAPLDGGVPGASRLVKGGPRESVLAPVWRDAASLYVVTDWTGWWNIYQVGLAGAPPQALYPAEEEFGGPLWARGAQPYAVLGDGRLAVTHGQGSARLGVLDPETCELTDLHLPCSEFSGGLSAAGMTVAAVAGGPAQPLSVVAVDVPTARLQLLRRGLPAMPDRAYLPAARHAVAPGRYGQAVHVVVYPPASPHAAGPGGERPPYVVWLHSGPASHVTAVLDLAKAYFTSRGIGIADVNYGGSTGYGRLYRERLHRQWGVADADDAIAVARWLVSEGMADPRRLAVRGCSAGALTALAAVTTRAGHSGVFSAAVSCCGICDLAGFAAHSNSCGSHGTDTLIGPLPGFEAVYADRSPLGHVSAATCPVLLLQGLHDPVAGPQQARDFAAELASHAVPHAHLEFAGGLRSAPAVAAALEAELAFFGQVLGFAPPGIDPVPLRGAQTPGS